MIDNADLPLINQEDLHDAMRIRALMLDLAGFWAILNLKPEQTDALIRDLKEKFLSAVVPIKPDAGLFETDGV